MANVGDTLPHCTGTGTQADPYKFDSATGFLEAIDVEGAYVEAKNSSMSFDCNDGVITPTINFKCLYINGKGLVIVNALIHNSSNPIIKVSGGTTAWDEYETGDIQEIRNINFYNFCIINYNLAMTLITSDFNTDNKYKVSKFINCNFAGRCVGYPPYTSHTDTGHHFIGHINIYSSEGQIQYHFINCTLNVNLSDPTQTTGKKLVFHSFWNSLADGEGYVYLENTTICFSGSIKYTFSLSDASVVMNNATTMSPLDKSANKLVCGSYINNVKFVSELSGYNYHKMYVETTGDLTVSDSQGLINSDRYTATGTKSLSGIVMQEHDSTASDYIYDENNLANAGFFVGQVIE